MVLFKVKDLIQGKVITIFGESTSMKLFRPLSSSKKKSQLILSRNKKLRLLMSECNDINSLINIIMNHYWEFLITLEYKTVAKLYQLGGIISLLH